jgi:hypothetical protein
MKGIALVAMPFLMEILQERIFINEHKKFKTALPNLQDRTEYIFT